MRPGRNTMYKMLQNKYDNWRADKTSTEYYIGYLQEYMRPYFEMWHERYQSIIPVKEEFVNKCNNIILETYEDFNPHMCSGREYYFARLKVFFAKT